MNRNAFLSLQQVSDFIDWLVLLLDEPQTSPLEHSWRSVNSSSCFKQGEVWQCSSLMDAMDRYKWPAKRIDGTQIYNLADTQALLSELSDALKVAIDKGEGVLESVNDILSWGGVKDKKNIARDIRRKLKTDTQRAFYLQEVGKKIHLDTFDPLQDTSIEVEGTVVESIVSDSGTTKIFALLFDEFAIYDSRVGAALGMLLARYIKHAGIEESDLVGALRFGWQDSPNKDFSRPVKPNGKRYDLTRDKQKRNPNGMLQKSVFPYLANVSDATRLSMNIYLNWILQSVVRKSKRLENQNPSHSVRNLEAALFMLGYSVNPYFDDNYWRHVEACA